MWDTYSVTIPKQKPIGYVEKQELKGKALWVTTENLDSKAFDKNKTMSKIELKQ